MILKKGQLDKSKAKPGHSEKIVKQHHLATAKQVDASTDAECCIKRMACDSAMGESSSTLPDEDVIYAGSEQCNSPIIVNSLGPELRMRNHCVMPKLPRGLAVRYR